MLRATEWAGFVGAGLAGAAYVPQICHLISAHCSAGLSRLALGAWLTASLLITTHAVAIGATAFIVLGVIQLVTTTLVLIYATKYENCHCATHRPRALAYSHSQRHGGRNGRASPHNRCEPARGLRSAPSATFVNGRRPGERDR